MSRDTNINRFRGINLRPACEFSACRIRTAITDSLCE